MNVSVLIKRINRRLARDGEQLRACRSERWRGELGDYYITNENNVVVTKHVEPESLARELAV